MKRLLPVLVLFGCGGNPRLQPCESEGIIDGAVFWLDEPGPLELNASYAVAVSASDEMDFEIRWTGAPRLGSVRLSLSSRVDEEPLGELVDAPTDLSTATCDARDGRFRMPFQLRLDEVELDGLDGCVHQVIHGTIPAVRDWDYGFEGTFGIIDGTVAAIVDLCEPAP